MWIVCYVDEKNHEVWSTAYDDDELFDLLNEIQYFDSDGNLLHEDLHIFRDSQTKDSEEIYRRLKKRRMEETR